MTIGRIRTPGGQCSLRGGGGAGRRQHGGTSGLDDAADGMSDRWDEQAVAVERRPREDGAMVVARRVDVESPAVDRRRTHLGRMLDGTAVGLVAVYQPIVDLATCAAVAFEALARGPSGSSLEMPSQLFAAATREGRLVDLDWACRRAAYRGAMAAGVPKGTPVFVTSSRRRSGNPGRSCPTSSGQRRTTCRSSSR